MTTDDLGLGEAGDAQRRGTAISRSQQQEAARRATPDAPVAKATLRDIVARIGTNNG